MKIGDVYCVQIKGFNGDHWGEIVEIAGKLFLKVMNPACKGLRNKCIPIVKKETK